MAGRRGDRPGDRQGGGAAARELRLRRGPVGSARPGPMTRGVRRPPPPPRPARATRDRRTRRHLPIRPVPARFGRFCQFGQGRHLARSQGSAARPAAARHQGRDGGALARQPHPPLVARTAGGGQQGPVERDDPARGKRSQAADQAGPALRGGQLAGRSRAALELVDEVAVDRVEPAGSRRRPGPARRRARASRACPAAASPGARSRPARGSGRRSSGRARARAVAAADRRPGPVPGSAAGRRRPAPTPRRPGRSRAPAASRSRRGPPRRCRGRPTCRAPRTYTCEHRRRRRHRRRLRRAGTPRGPAPRPGRGRGSRPGPRRGLAATDGADASPR